MREIRIMGISDQKIGSIILLVDSMHPLPP